MKGTEALGILLRILREIRDKQYKMDYTRTIIDLIQLLIDLLDEK